MTLVELAVSPDRYEIRTVDASLHLTISPPGRVVWLGFAQSWREVAKGKLIKRLLAKQFEPVVPRPRIRLRRIR